jgi:hypothetical protein
VRLRRLPVAPVVHVILAFALFAMPIFHAAALKSNVPTTPPPIKANSKAVNNKANSSSKAKISSSKAMISSSRTIKINSSRTTKTNNTSKP